MKTTVRSISISTSLAALLMITCIAFAATPASNPLRSKADFLRKIKELEDMIGGKDEMIKKLQLELKSKDSAIEELTDENKQLRDICIKANIKLPEKTGVAAGNSEIATAFKKPLTVGQVSYLENDKYKQVLEVIQVIDERNVLVKFMFGYHIAQTRTRSYASTHGVETVWLKGLSTEGLVDGSPIKTNKAFKITGTKTYTTADRGAATVFMLEPVSISLKN
jgi:hypothetical protein